jgi:ribosomal protein S18 acetylase RimI-like enzyme
MRIRLMTHEDTSFALSLTDSLGWGNTKDEFERLLSYEPEGCFIASEREEHIGMVTSVSYGKVGWIGNVIVIPGYRNKGMGTKLMVQAMDYLKNKSVKTIELDAEQKAMSLYNRLGFKAVCKSLRFSGEGKFISTDNIKQMSESDIDNVVGLDSRIFGANRHKVIKKIYQKFPDLCFVSYKNQKLIGYIMARERKDDYQIGPWICQSDLPDSAEGLLKAALKKLMGNKIRIGTLELNKHSVTMIKKYCFNEIEYSVRMYYGEKKESGDVRGEFAIGAPDKG